MIAYYVGWIVLLIILFGGFIVHTVVMIIAKCKGKDFSV